MRIFSTAPRRWLVLLIILSPFVLIAYLSYHPLTWPQGEITYYNASEWGPEVRRAAEKWNSTGANIHLTPTKNRQSADLVIFSSRHQAMLCPTRYACVDTLGWTPLYQSKMRLPDRARAGGESVIHKVIAHEFGHVIGLNHSNGAYSLMRPGNIYARCDDVTVNSTGNATYASRCMDIYSADKCLLKEYSKFACGPLPGDISKVTQLYGGSLRKDYNPSCTIKRQGDHRRIRRAIRYAQTPQGMLLSKVRAAGVQLDDYIPDIFHP